MLGGAALTLLLAIGSPAPVHVPPAAETAQRILADPAYQSEFPGNPARDDHRVDFYSPGVARFLKALAYVVVAVAVGAFLFAVIQRRLPAAPRAVSPASTTAPAARPAAPPPAPRPTLTLDDADRLAGEGAYREAVHALLVVAIGGVSRTTARSFPPSATSRELARSLPLAAELRDEFGALVGAVERSLFAGDDADEAEYAACRTKCVRLLGQAA